MVSFPTLRVNSPSYTSIKAQLVLRKHLPRIRGTRGSGSKSTTTKSAGNWNTPTLTLTSLAIPIGREIERSASSSVMHVGVKSGRLRFFHRKMHGFMLAPDRPWLKPLIHSGKFTWNKESAGVTKFFG
ncbi:hypothetical protein Tco_0567018 [Tanacetum coccineum]